MMARAVRFGCAVRVSYEGDMREGNAAMPTKEAGMGMKKLFVIGGMGAGKSTARKVLAEQGVP